MKFDFTYYNPTKIYFRKDSLDNLEEELKKYGKTILLVYGKNSIKKSGLYDKVIEILKSVDKKIIKLAGIKSNPTYKQMMEGAKLVKENNADLILAVGGGSVITHEEKMLKNGRVFPVEVYPKFSILNP